MPSRDQFTTEIYVNNEQARDALSALGKQLDKLRSQYANLSKSSKNYDARERELAEQIKATEQAIATAEKGAESYGRAMENLSKRSINNLIKLQRQLNSEIKKLDPNDAEFEKLSKNYQKVTQRIKDLEAAQKGISTGGFFKNLASGLSKYAGAIVVGYQTVKRVVSGFMDAYKTISGFEQANANLASILGATSDQMEVLEKDAVQLGSSTRYSASQVTELQTELAKLGFTVKEITDMAPAVLNFAGSVGTDLASAASLAGVALRSFNLQSDQTEDALGTMAVACNKSALSFTYLQNSFSTIAPVAKTYGLSLKDTIALLGTLANAGFDASSAATATRNILLKLADANGKLAKSLGGSVHSFEDIMNAMIQLRDQGVDLNKTLELTDKRSVAAFNTFLDGAESAMTLRGELEDVNGELQRMAEQRANTVEGAIDGMKSAWEGLVLSFRNSTGTFSKVFKFITQGINGIRDMIDPEGSIVERNAKGYAEVLRGVGNEFISVYETQERIQKKFEDLNKGIEGGGGTARYKRYAKEGLQRAYDEVMAELESQAEKANAKVQEVNAKFMNEEQKILKQQAKLTENGLNASNMAAYNKLQEKLEANRKLWRQAIDDATRFKEKMDDIVSGDDPGGGGGNGGGGGLTEKELAKQKLAYNKEKAILDAALNYEEKQLKLSLLKKEITEEEYIAKIKEKKAQYYYDLLALAEKYHQDGTAIQAAILDDQIKELEEAAKKAADIAKKEAENFEKTRQKAIASLKKELEELEKLEKDAQDVKDKLHPRMKVDREFDDELKNLEKMHKAKLLSEEDYLAAVEALHKDHNRKLMDLDIKDFEDYVKLANAVISYASNFVTQLKEMETAQLEAEYQKQLTAAGENAEQREAIEAEYEQKKLDLQKKYADVEMGINIAKAIGAGALAIAEAWTAAGGNPILFAVFAALIAATTALEIATLVQQRNAIKNASVSGGGGSSSAPSTGQRTITGHAEGGFTENHTTLSTVGEEGTEWIAPHWMVRDNPTTFASLERYRRSGSHGRSGSIERGFADGGFTGAAPKDLSTESDAAIERAVFNGIRAALQNRWIRAFLVRKDLTDMDNQDERFKDQLTR